jgi:hypothetical protein
MEAKNANPISESQGVTDDATSRSHPWPMPEAPSPICPLVRPAIRLHSQSAPTNSIRVKPGHVAHVPEVPSVRREPCSRLRAGDYFRLVGQWRYIRGGINECLVYDSEPHTPITHAATFGG